MGLLRIIQQDYVLLYVLNILMVMEIHLLIDVLHNAHQILISMQTLWHKNVFQDVQMDIMLRIKQEDACLIVRWKK